MEIEKPEDNVKYPDPIIEAGGTPVSTEPQVVIQQKADTTTATLTTPLIGEKETKPKKKNPCLRCCCCCCCTCLCMCVCLFVCAISVVLLYLIVTGIMYGVCVSNKNSGTKRFNLNSTITHLQFDNFGDVSVHRSDEYYVVVKYRVDGDPSTIYLAEDTKEDTAKIVAPGYAFYVYGPAICVGYDIEIHKPQLQKLNLEFSNHLGKVNITGENLDYLVAKKWWGTFHLEHMIVSNDIDVQTEFTENSANNIIVWSGDFMFESKFSMSKFDTISAPSGNVKLEGRHHDFQVSDLAVHGNLTIDGYNGIYNIDCNEKMINTGINVKRLDYSDVVINNCAFGEGQVKIPKAAFSTLTMTNIARQTVMDWSLLDIGDISYSTLKLENTELLSLNMPKARFTNLDYKLTQDDFFTYKINFDLEGENSHWLVDSEIPNMIHFDTERKNHVRGSINPDGTEKEEAFFMVNGDFNNFKIHVVNSTAV